MPYSFVATKDYIDAQKNVLVLVRFAETENVKGRQNTRALFLKLCVVFMVTRFQVYIEAVLKEFEFEIKRTGKRNDQLPLHFRLNSIRIETEKNQLHKKLEDPTAYGTQKFTEISALIVRLGDWCTDTSLVHPDLRFETKFPLGATGLGELRKLLKQVDGKDLFGKVKFDIEKLNEILRRRHSIIHEDANQQITETTVKEYREFMAKVVRHIDKYLGRIVN